MPFVCPLSRATFDRVKQLPVPIGPFEKAGSESIQKLLDKDMQPVLDAFCAAYVTWSEEP